MDSIDKYVTEINRYSLLSRERELELARQYRKTGDEKALHELVCANLRFVVKIAQEYRGYKLKPMDLIQEGNLGLVVAVKKFDPEKGHRLISYGVWWIRAYMWSYAIHSWSMVKVGTTQAQRKLFFALRSARARAEVAAGPGESVDTAGLAKELGVKESDIATMDMRLAGRDFSLDAPIEEGRSQPFIDNLVDDGDDAETLVSDAERRRLVRQRVQSILRRLNEREGYIVLNRLLADEGQTLRQIGNRFHISRERTRQIESTVIRKLSVSLTECGLQGAA